jgi:hypothetical protein
MSINLNCPHRIKPKLLREQKTEALLVFIRTTLEQFFAQIEEQGYQCAIGNKADYEHIHSTLKNLLEHLQECVINSSYLRSLIANAHKNPSLKLLTKKEEPLMVYYDSIVKGIETKLANGTNWIPELVVISLLSEWLLEEEKSVDLYPFLKEIDYMDMIERYDRSKPGLDTDKREIIMNMYRISSYLITRLKDAKYKMNTNRKKKRK